MWLGSNMRPYCTLIGSTVSGPTIAVDTWTHVACVFDSVSFRMPLEVGPQLRHGHSIGRSRRKALSSFQPIPSMSGTGRLLWVGGDMPIPLVHPR
jgi:hypothetical protein